MFTLKHSAVPLIAGSMLIPLQCLPKPDGEDPVVEFVTPDDGDTVAELPSGSIVVTAFDPDVGDSDGVGIRSVKLIITDEQGQVVASSRDQQAAYEFGANLPDGTYELTAKATSTGDAGGTSSEVTITVVIGESTPPTTAPTTTVVPTTEMPTTVPPTTDAPTTVAPTTDVPTPTTAAPTTAAPTTAGPTTVAPTTAAPVTAAPVRTAPVTAAPSTAPPATPRAAGEVERAASASLAALNSTRAAAGVGPLRLDGSMTAFARDWSRTMSTSGFAHSSGPYAENIAYTSDTSLSPEGAAEYFNGAWVNSPGHYANMTNATYTTVGIGLVPTESGWFATHVFA
jgi:uncharacterized protein YkwD